ncbi:MAG: hypothetical protein CMJ19_17355 [Phycisphaeraceae bacterium]|nr:hypothetical protein [Phycisphaeraceae bacterium]
MYQLIKVCCVVATWLFFTPLNASVSYRIYSEGNKIICEQVSDQTKVFENSNATKVLKFALENIKKEGGGSIHLVAGEYKLNRSIELGNKTTLTGDGISTKIQFSNQEPLEGGIYVNQSDGVTISNLSVSLRKGANVDAGIIVDNSGVCKITDVYVIGFRKYGIWLRNRSFLSTIDRCTLAGNLLSNIYLDQLNKDGRIGSFIPNMVTNSMIIGGGKGIEANNSLVVNIVGCMFHQTNDIAIHLHSISNAILISGCHTFQISDDAIVIEDTDELNISSNVISWHEGHGLVVKNSAWGTVSSNKFIDNGSYNTGASHNSSPVEELPDNFELKNGIMLNNVIGYHVGGNSIYNWGVVPRMKYGIEEDSLSYNNIIKDNCINYFDLEAVRSMGKGTIVKDNISEGEIPYTRLKRLTDKENRKRFETSIIQSYQTELTDEFIEALKE